jgi:signal transduction histidine kinase
VTLDDSPAEALAREQGALRRIATLVARGAAPEEVFAAVTNETRHVLDADATALFRYEEGEEMTRLAQDVDAPSPVPIGTRLRLDGDSAAKRVRQTARPARMESYERAAGPVAALQRERGIAASAGAPIVVEGRLWGVVLAAWSQGRAMPDGSESRLAQFSELTATAIANAQSRAALRELADRQAAVGRVATLVAGGATPDVVFDAVTEETLALLGANGTALMRYEGDGTALVLSQLHRDRPPTHVGARIPLEGDSVTARVRLSRRPARIESYAAASGSMSEVVRDLGYTVVVGTPIAVEGFLWGVMVAAWTDGAVPPSDAEDQLAGFTGLVAMALSNAESRTQLAASRARLVVAADDARRRIQRNLHDGTQQRLVTIELGLRTALTMVDGDNAELAATLEGIVATAEQAVEELQDIARGLHPAVLARGGLPAALNTIIRQSAIAVELSMDLPGRLPQSVEVAAYYIVAEALTNAAKHAQAARVEVRVTAGERELALTVRDDGTGGADQARGSGLIGLRDRVEALGGTLELVSPPGEGTRLSVRLPLAGTGAGHTNL